MKFSEISKRIAEAELGVEDMHYYQHMGVDFILKTKKCALFIDLGMGKSCIAGTAAAELVSRLEVDKVLIIAPLLVANTTWPEQFETWRQLAGYDYELLSADKDTPNESKAEAICRRSRDSKASFHFVQKDMVHILVDFWRRDWPYKMIIIDESSKVKDHSTQIFKKLNLLFDYVDYMVELTATPAAEGYMGLFAQMALLDRGERLGTHITHYRNDYFKQDVYTRKWKPLKGSEEEIDAKISDITLVMKAEQYLEGHSKAEFVEHKIPMTAGFMRQYGEMEKESVLTLGETEIVADNAAAVWSKLLQMASGMVYETWETPHPTRVGKMKKHRKAHHLHDAKLDELEELIDQLNGKPLLVGYYWEESLTRLKERFPKAVVLGESDSYKAKWDAGKIPLLLAHPMSAGHGLNLQKPTNHMCFFDLHPSLENFLQFIGRINRQGQKLQVFVHLFLAKGTYDTRVWESLKNKEDGQDRLLNRLRRMQRKYREEFLKLFYGE
jgi:hypothetical protein